MKNDLKIIKSRKLTLQIIHTAAFQEGVNGAIMKTAPEKYAIFINANIPEKQQVEAFLHECLHLYHGDLDRENVNVNSLESERHAELDIVLPDLMKGE